MFLACFESMDAKNLLLKLGSDRIEYLTTKQVCKCTKLYDFTDSYIFSTQRSGIYAKLDIDQYSMAKKISEGNPN